MENIILMITFTLALITWITFISWCILGKRNKKIYYKLMDIVIYLGIGYLVLGVIFLITC